MKKRRKQSKAWNIVPLAAITVFVLALVIKIGFPDAFKQDNTPPVDSVGDNVVQQPSGTITDQSDTSDITDEPDIPNEPDIPDEPDIPQDPTITDEPNLPDAPDTPEVPEVPDEPSAPGEAYADDWKLILINPTHSLPEGYEVTLETVQSKYKMDYRAASKAKEMIADAKAEGIDLLVCSAYRSHDKQTTNFNNKLQSYLDKGWDYDEAYAKTATIIAVPGTSEHESGLALDIVTPSYQVLDAGYKNTDAAKWLLANAADYGFILRFPEDKQDITKIIFEPWHYRYVGEEYSHLIMDSGLCLEEWLGQVD